MIFGKVVSRKRIGWSTQGGWGCVEHHDKLIREMKRTGGAREGTRTPRKKHKKDRARGGGKFTVCTRSVSFHVYASSCANSVVVERPVGSRR